MPSQETASTKEKNIKCEVLRAIGIEATKEAVEHLERRAKSKGIKFTKEGLTTMIHPNKPVYDKQKKDFIPGEPVFVNLDKETAKKLQAAGAVRVVID